MEPWLTPAIPIHDDLPTLNSPVKTPPMTESGRARLHSPRRLTGLILLSIFGLLLAALVLVLPVWTSLQCQRSPTQLVSCQIRGKNLMGIPWRYKTVKPMVGAESNLQSIKGGYRYRISVFTYEDEMLLAPFSLDYASAAEAEESIRKFLGDNNHQTFQLTYRPPVMVMVTAVLFALVGLAMGGILVWL